MISFGEQINLHLFLLHPHKDSTSIYTHANTHKYSPAHFHMYQTPTSCYLKDKQNPQMKHNSAKETTVRLSDGDKYIREVKVTSKEKGAWGRQGGGKDCRLNFENATHFHLKQQVIHT